MELGVGAALGCTAGCATFFASTFSLSLHSLDLNSRSIAAALAEADAEEARAACATLDLDAAAEHLATAADMMLRSRTENRGVGRCLAAPPSDKMVVLWLEDESWSWCSRHMASNESRLKSWINDSVSSGENPKAFSTGARLFSGSLPAAARLLCALDLNRGRDEGALRDALLPRAMVSSGADPDILLKLRVSSGDGTVCDASSGLIGLAAARGVEGRGVEQRVALPETGSSASHFIVADHKKSRLCTAAVRRE